MERTSPRLKDVLRSKPKEQKQIGVALIVLGMIGFFVSMQLLGLFGSTVQGRASHVSKESLAFSFIVLSMYGAGYIFGKNEGGLRWAAAWAVFFVVAALLGYWGEKYTPAIQPFFSLILGIIVIGWIVYSRRHK